MTRKEDELKERVIHTRVPESLEAELRKRAEDLGISVSNLVRNVLGHAVGLVGDVTADVNAFAHKMRVKTTAEEPLGYQQMVLAKNAICARCNDVLPKGSDAAIAVPGSSMVCLSCLDGLTGPGPVKKGKP